jgi:hypothetical protein
MTATFFRTIDPVIDLTENVAPKQIVTESPQEFRIITYPSTAFSQSYINWNIIPPNPQVVIARYFRVQITFQITVNATIKQGVNQANVINTLYSGICQYPLHQCISNLTVQLNNHAVTIRPTEIIPKLMYYVFDHETHMSTMSTTAAYPDQTLYYSESDTFVTSPFGSYGDSCDHVSRNSLPIVFQPPGNPTLDANNTQGNATFRITICEPLIMSPLVFDKYWYRRPGFTMINNIIINMSIDPAAIQRIWRQSTGDLVTYNSVQVVFDQPSLLLYYKTLPTYIAPPNTLSYPFASIQNFVYQYSNQITPAQPTFQLTTNTVQFQTIPHRIIVSVTKSRQQLTFNDADSFVPITNINITWDNKSGVLSTLTQYDLYQICVKNGLKMSWANFSGQEIRLFNQLINKTFHGTSAPLALDFGTDIALLNEDFPGKKGTWNFQITVTCVNNRTEAQWLPQVDLIVIYTGKIDIINATVNQSVGIEPGAAITTLGKVSYPIDVDIYSGGKFDLGTLLAAIPGRLIKGIGSLLSGIFGGDKSEEPSTGFTAAYTPTPPPQAPVRSEIRLEDLSPSLIRQLKKLLRNTE